MVETPLKVVILSGLPGAGKTYFAEHYADGYASVNERILNICFDRYDMKQLNVSPLIRDKIANTRPDTIILDGPWYTKESIAKLLNNVNKAISEKFIWSSTHTKYAMRHIDIIRFDGDESICRKNAETNDYVCPDHEYIDEPFIMDLHEKFGISRYKISIIPVPVEDWSHYKNTFEGYRLGNSDLLLSVSWITDGRDCDCWGACEPISPQCELKFEKFYELLYKICPSISEDEASIMLKDTCHQVSEKTEEDYYGSWTEDTYWVCDLKKLYSLLLERNLIKKD